MASLAPAYWWTAGKRGLVGNEEGFLGVSGRDFVTKKDGKRWQLRGYHVHYAINAMWDPKLDLDGVLDELIELGANTIVTFGIHASQWKTDHGWRCTPIEHPDYYTRLGKMFDKFEDRRVRCAHAINVDMQWLPASFDKQRYFREVCAVMAGRALLLGRKGNESDHNGWNQNEYIFPDMRGVLCSQGSIGEDVPPRLPYLDWCELSLRRDLPKMFVDAPLRQIMDGDFNQENGRRGVPTNRPTCSMEPIFFDDTNPDQVDDDRSTDERVALELGFLTAACAGGAIGLSDALEVQRLKPHARKIAKEYFRGMDCYVRPFAGLDFQGDH